MENNPYNRKIAEQLKEINNRYLEHLNLTGKQVVDSDLVPLVKPNVDYEGSGILSGLLGSIGLGKRDIAKLKGAGFFDDMISGISTGFKMPFQLVNKVLGGAKAKKMEAAGLLSGPLSLFGLGKEGGLIKVAKGKAHYGKQSKSVVSGNVGGIARAVGSGNVGVEGAGIFDDIGEFVGNVKKVLPLAAMIGIGKTKGGKRGRPRKAGAVGVQAMAEHRNALTGGKRRRGRPSKAKMEGEGLVDTLKDVAGITARKAGPLALRLLAESIDPTPKPKRRGRPRKVAGGPLSGLLGAIGLGEDKKAVGGKRRGRPRKAKMEGEGLFDDAFGHLGKIVGAVPKVIETADKAHKLAKSLGFGESKKGGKKGGAKAGSWVKHVKDYAKKHNISYKDALKQARSSYKK